MKFTQLLNLIPSTTVQAHCDVPCGIYETDTMKHAAHTVAVMTDKLKSQIAPDSSDHATWVEYQNTVARMVATKELHAALAKEQILMLWSDFFKPDNAPDGLHDKVWAAAKLCSRAKQTVDPATAQKLVEAVAEIASLFDAAKAKHS